MPDVELRWIGGRRGLEAGLVPPEGIELDRLWLRSLRSTEASIHALLDPLRLGGSFSQALVMVASRRPAAVFATGGYVAIPVLAACAALGVPALLWEGNLVPGRSTRLAARWAAALGVSFEPTCRALRGACYVTGTPIRPLLGIDREAARAHFGVGPADRCLLIFGGSQAVRRFDGAVAQAMPSLAERAVVLHVSGEAAYPDALRRREALPEALRPRYQPFPFLRDEMGEALVAADIVVGRAGSSTLAEVTALGCPLVVVPYPHAAGHQRANALALAEIGAAELVEDDAFDGPALLRALALLDDPGRASAMRAASRSTGRPGAAAANVDLLLALAERRPLPAADAVERLSRGVG